jgi:hypothetical protein
MLILKIMLRAQSDRWGRVKVIGTARRQFVLIPAAIYRNRSYEIYEIYTVTEMEALTRGGERVLERFFEEQEFY